MKDAAFRLVASAVALAATAALAASAPAAHETSATGSAIETGATTTSPAGGDRVTWSRAVTRICAGALLFEHRHEIGTRSGALAVARDIRLSTRRRLVRISALSVSARPPLATNWLGVERRLALAYARSYVRIFQEIDAAHTPAQRERLPRLLGRLLHAPDRLGDEAIRLQVALGVPDCTGGHPETNT